MISIIVPVYNEERVLSRNFFHFQNIAKICELIFVDGGSSDKSVEIAAGCGRVLQTKKARALQMNYGSKSARGDILLFLHADAFIYPKTISAIEGRVALNDLVGGCLTQRIEKQALIYRLIEGFGNLRAKITKVFYGDQGIFVKKEEFLKIDGFPQAPIMEDVLFSKKLRRQGKTEVLAEKILVSPRRWEQRGIIKTVCLYFLINILFLLRFPLSRIKALYTDLR